MRAVIAVYGSRGDVQPALALAIGLQKAGHSVLLTAPPNFESWIQSYGVPFLGVGLDAEEVLRDVGMNIPKALGVIRSQARYQFEDHEEAMRGADVIIGAAVHCAGRSFAELQNVPYLYASFAPQTFRSQAHSNLLLDLGRVPGWVNAAVWRGSAFVFNRLFLSGINHERTKRGLKPVSDVWNHIFGGDALYAGETALSPLPDDLQPGIVTTGAWILEDTTEVDAGTEAFLRAGTRPVYIGFGSMPDGNPEATSRTIAEAVQRSGVRAVVSAGWAKLGSTSLPPSIRVVGATPHAKLFPRLAAVVHHGGAGTTAATARAGVPHVVVPHGYDQYHWGRRVHDLGLGVKPIPKTRLTVERLTEALRIVTTDAAMRARTAEFASRLTTDGVKRTVEHLESVVQAHRARLGLAIAG